MIAPTPKSNGYGDMPCGNGSGDSGKVFNANDGADKRGTDGIIKSEPKIPLGIREQNDPRTMSTQK